MENVKYDEYPVPTYHAQPCWTGHGTMVLTLPTSQVTNLLLNENTGMC